MLESEVEKDWCDRARQLGYKSIKFIDPGRRGAPDRLVLGYKGESFFIEFKRPKGGKLSMHQKAYHADLRKRGFDVYLIKNIKQNTELLEHLK